MSKIKSAERLANLIFNLLPLCQEKEALLAKEYRLHPSEFKCLRLFEVDEKLNNMDIAIRMNLSQSRLTRIIDGLEKKEYMKREINRKDRRNIKLSLSRRGKLLANKLNKELIEIHHKILKDIDPKQHKPLITAMVNLNSAVERWLKKPR